MGKRDVVGEDKSIRSNRSHERLFLMDGFGALTSAALLFFLVAAFESFFGMPKAVVHLLSFIAVLFSVCSFGCRLIGPQNWKAYLLLIAIANVAYCLLTSALVVYYFAQVTHWGLMYFVGEIAIISTVVYVELKAVLK